MLMPQLWLLASFLAADVVAGSPIEVDSRDGAVNFYGLTVNDTSEADYSWDDNKPLNDTGVLGTNSSQPPALDSLWNFPVLNIIDGDPQVNSSGFPVLNSSGQPLLDNSAPTLEDASGDDGQPVRTGRKLLGNADYPGKPFHKFNRMVALGDSYSAGPNAGTTIPGSLPHCYQTGGGWPAQLNQSLGDGNQFEFLACTGATTEDIQKQVQSPNFGDPDLVTVTMGGNDNGAFANVVKNCVVYYPNPSSGGCNVAIANAKTTIRNINGNLVQVLSDISRKPAAGNRDIVVVGYPRLFSTDWPRVLNCWTSQVRRLQLNALVDSLNQELAAAVRDQWTANQIEGHNRNVDVMYVDPNQPIADKSQGPPSDFSFEGHRYCELTGLAYLQVGGLGSWSTDFKSAFYKGLFHPTWNGFTVMSEAAQYILTQKYIGA